MGFERENLKERPTEKSILKLYHIQKKSDQSFGLECVTPNFVQVVNYAGTFLTLFPCPLCGTTSYCSTLCSELTRLPSTSNLTIISHVDEGLCFAVPVSTTACLV